MEKTKTRIWSAFFYWPGPANDFSMNFFLAKHIHHLLGLPSSVENTFSQTRLPVSWRICWMYWRSKSVGNQRKKGLSRFLQVKIWIMLFFNLTSIIWCGRFCINRIQWKSIFARDIKPSNCQWIHFLLSLIFVCAFL